MNETIEQLQKETSDLIAQFDSISKITEQCAVAAHVERDLEKAQSLLDKFSAENKKITPAFYKLDDALERRIKSNAAEVTTLQTASEMPPILELERLKSKGKINTDYVVVIPALENRFYRQIVKFEYPEELINFYEKLAGNITALEKEAFINVLYGYAGELPMFLNSAISELKVKATITDAKLERIKQLEEEKPQLEKLLEQLRAAARELRARRDLLAPRYVFN